MLRDPQLDVIVRFHDARRLLELERAIFSVVSQTYRPLHIHICLQRFSVEDVERVRATLAPFFPADDALRLSVHNWGKQEPEDARSVLLNIGLNNSTGRYVAFLDYDDILYPEAYELLTTQLNKTGSAIAFASIRPLRANIYNKFICPLEEVIPPPFTGSNLIDLFRSNFCPIHSFAADRRQVKSNILYLETELTLEEDYDLLLRICAEYLSDFSLLGVNIGDYYWKTDSSNSVASAARLSDARLEYYNKVVLPMIERRKRTTKISREVLRLLGLQGNGYTIRDALSVYDQHKDRRRLQA